MSNENFDSSGFRQSGTKKSKQSCYQLKVIDVLTLCESCSARGEFFASSRAPHALLSLSPASHPSSLAHSLRERTSIDVQ